MRNPEPISEEFISLNIQSGRPQIMGVYFLIYKKELIYIGSSKDVHFRLKQHKAHSFFKFDKYAIYPVTRRSGESYTCIERACIRKYKPKYNVSGNPDYECGENPVWFTFVSQWKSYRKVAEVCGLPMAMCERVIEGNKHCDNELDIAKIEEAVLSREVKIQCAIPKQLLPSSANPS